MDFFHSLPVPELWEWVFSIPFPFPNFTNGFFDSKFAQTHPNSPNLFQTLPSSPKL